MSEKWLCDVGDLAHHPVLLLQKPLTEFKYDTDPKQSAQSRVKMLSMLADKRFKKSLGEAARALSARKRHRDCTRASGLPFSRRRRNRRRRATQTDSSDQL